jgi:pyridoxine 5-phosphate synthase
MAKLSVNLNKFALVRNARGEHAPDLLQIARQCIKHGVHGITVHPRADGRHILYSDVHDLAKLVKQYPQIELNVEGYPTAEFIALINKVKPAQVTLVPDAPEQLTSDHGWQLHGSQELLTKVISQFDKQVRVSLFIDRAAANLALAKQVGATRIELYTQDYARAFAARNLDTLKTVLTSYQQTAKQASDLGLAVNAGHDLNLSNLHYLLTNIQQIQEVSIGHALVIEAWEYGLAATLRQYLSKLA